MRGVFIAAVCLLFVVPSSYGQDKKDSVTTQETKGVCSPIGLPDLLYQFHC